MHSTSSGCSAQYPNIIGQHKVSIEQGSISGRLFIWMYAFPAQHVNVLHGSGSFVPTKPLNSNGHSSSRSSSSSREFCRLGSFGSRGTSSWSSSSSPLEVRLKASQLLACEEEVFNNTAVANSIANDDAMHGRRRLCALLHCAVVPGLCDRPRRRRWHISLG